TLFGEKFKIHESIKFKTPATREEFEETLMGSARKLVKDAPRELLISAAGVGLAGTTDGRNGEIKAVPNLPFLEGFSFRRALDPICRCDVIILNDIHAALYGELKLGRAVGY